MNTLEYLLSRTEKTESGCLLWQGLKTKNGYGKTSYKRKTWSCHRLVKFLETGREGAVAMHKCDTKTCINPAHIEWGTQKKNLMDMSARGRSALAKITPVVASEIRRIYSTGKHTQEQVAKMFGLTQTNVSNIVLRKTWVNI